MQCLLSARLIWSNTAFVDEATYLYAGHQEIHAILDHGTLTVPGQNGYYQAYFSGAPVLYPVLGAIADSLGGLAAARMLSLMFMLGATTLLCATASRLFDRRTGIAASAVFAILGPTQFLGAFATYDAMALSLMGLAAFLAVRSAQEDENTLTLLYSSLAMVFADATKYAVMLFDPVIIGLVMLACMPHRGWRRARLQAYRMLAYSGTAAAVLLGVGGHTYLKGLMSTTLARAGGRYPALLVLSDSWRWVGAAAVLAAIGVVMHLGKENQKLWICLLLATAIVLVPLEQARIHTGTSLQKHVDFGAWFAAIVAGYVLARLFPAHPNKILAPVITAAAASAAAVAASFTSLQAAGLYQAWGSSTHEVAALRPWVHGVNILAEDYFIYSYYLGPEVPLQRWSNTWHLEYKDPETGRKLTGVRAYQDAIHHHYFGTIALSYGTTAQLDRQIVSAISASGGYRRVTHIHYGGLWFDVFHDSRAR